MGAIMSPGVALSRLVEAMVGAFPFIIRRYLLHRPRIDDLATGGQETGRG